MNTVLVVFVASFGVVAIAFLGIGIKMLLRRNGEFKRQCSHVDPYTGKSAGCSCTMVDKVCSNKAQHPYQPLEVNRELMKEMGHSDD